LEISLSTWVSNWPIIIPCFQSYFADLKSGDSRPDLVGMHPPVQRGGKKDPLLS